MATTIRVQCEAGHSFEVRGSDLTLLVNEEMNGALYRFECPQCRWTCTKDASARIVGLLAKCEDVEVISMTSNFEPMNISALIESEIAAFKTALDSDDAVGHFE